MRIPSFRLGPDGTARCAVSLLALVVLVVLLAPAALEAQDLNGFFPPRGETQIALSYSSESWDQFWRGTVKVPTPPFLGKADITTFSLWMRHGITDRLALVGTLPYVNAESDGDPGFDESSLQDLTLLAKYRLAVFDRGSAGRHVLAVAAGFRTPATNYEANLPVDVGDGTTDALLRFVYQYETGRFYFSQEVGFDLRSEDAPNGFPFYTELGYRTGQVTWIASFSALWADGGTDIGDPGFTFPSNQEEYQRYGLRLYARFTERLGLSVGGFATLDGRNTADTSGYFVGLVSSI
jgi:hypothetical protein